MKEGIKKVIRMDVHAESLIPIALEQLLRLVHGYLAVGTGKGGNVELEDDSVLVEPFVIFHVHILVTLGVGEDRGVTVLTDALKQFFHLEGRVEVAGLHKEETVVEGEKVARLETLLEEVIKHVLGTKA